MNLILPIFSVFLLTLLQIVFYSKERINSSETKFYKYLMIISSLNIIFNIIGIYNGYNSGDLVFLKFLNHFDLPLYFWWASLLLLYFVFIDLNESKKLTLIRNIVIALNILFTILTIFLPFDVIVSSTEGYAIGLCVNFVYAICAVYIILSLFESIRITRKGYYKKAVPVFVLIFLGAGAAVIQKSIPNLIIVPSVIVYIELIMFFTIENPDLKMLEEYNKNRELVEAGFEERANLLFKITQDVKNPIKKIKLYSDNILQSDDIEENNEMAYNISQISGNLIDTVDEVLSISTLDRKNVKIYNLSYDVYNIFNQIIYITKSKLDKTIEFKYSISDTIPTKLDGDSLKLKQIICSLLLKDNKSNSIVDLDISHLIKDDVCRLIITINKTASNLSLHDVNEILSSDIEINKGKLEELDNLVVDYGIVKKLVDLLNGNFIIKTDDKEITFTIIIDQLIDKNYNDNTVLKLAEKISNKKKVLLVDDDYKELTALSNELKKNNFDVDAIMYGEDAITKLASNEKYDILLIDDEMTSGNAVVLIGRIDELKLNDLVKIVMLDGKKESIKKYYINDYSFVDCLIKDNYKEEIKRIKEQYK